ncbi:hypothetical protein [Clostridium thermobutyricum]|uniref:hypothetical protein n=1 Tax=Clostridium thermobutyricum TaxID=29372 RepID=UPI0018A90142|nr:hypothetical protein [Clostridium thermobutyricum]
MKDIINVKKYIIIYYIIFSLILLSLPAIFINNLNDQFKIMCILPISYSVIVLFLFNVKKERIIKNKAILIILSTYFIRMYLYPIIICFKGIEIYNFNRAIDNRIIISVLLQIYEFISIAICITVIKYNKLKKIKIKEIDKLNINKIIYYIIFISIISIIIFPSILSIFRPIVFKDINSENIWKINRILAKENLNPIIYNIVGILIPIARILLTILIIIKIRKLNLNKKISRNKSIIFSIIIALNLLIFITDDRAGNIYCFIAVFLVIRKLYDLKNKVSINIIFVIMGLILLYIFFGKSNEILSSRLNAYFSGTINIGASTLMERNNIIQYLLGDILRHIPIIKGLFINLPMSNELFNMALGIDTVYNSQIIPNIGQGIFYFGYVFSPILSIILSYIGIKLWDKSENNNSIFEYFILIFSSIFFSVGSVMYYFTLTINLVLLYVGIMFIINMTSKIQIKGIGYGE